MHKNIFLERRDIRLYSDGDNVLVGTRYAIYVPHCRSRYMAADVSSSGVVDAIDTEYANMINRQPDLQAFLENGSAVTVDESNVIEVGSISDFKRLMNKARKYEDALIAFQDKFYETKEDIEYYLRSNGLYFDESMTDGNTLSLRFLGGYEAWSGDEDICDADILDKKVGNKVMSLLKKYAKDHGLDIVFYTGEKAWSYIEVNLRR